MSHYVDGSFHVIHKQEIPVMGIVGTGMLGTVMSPEDMNKAKLKPINQRKKESTSSLAEDHSRAASRRT